MASESETVRAEFEAWALPNCFGMRRYADGYETVSTQTAWIAWQAARSSTPSAEAKDAERLVWVGKNWTDNHSLRYASRILRGGGTGDIGDMRAYVDAAIAQQPKEDDRGPSR